MYKSMLITVIYNLRLQNILIYSFHLGPVNSSPEKFKNLALFLQIGLPSILTCHGAFRKRSSNRRNLKPSAFRFIV